MKQMTKKEKLYLDAKTAYYAGNDIMTDAEFDDLEAELKMLKSSVIVNVGAIDRNAKFPHPSPMLSLSKYQSDKLTGEPPVEETEEWMKSIANVATIFEASCKYDGNAVNSIYEKKNGVLTLDRILSRGDGSNGRDYTSKLSMHMPKHILDIDADVVEIRAEVVIPNTVFEKKYYNGRNNARNFVAGVLNRLDKDVKQSDLKELVVMCHEVKIDRGMSYMNIVEAEEKLGINPIHKIFIVKFDNTMFLKLFNIYKDYRETSPFLMDGIVIKTDESVREQLGENSHDPNWAKAIKFKPVGATTTVNDIEWNLGKTGAYTPVFIFEPVVLDGTVVKRASGYNFEHIKKTMTFPGATVRIAKAGDIIPQVIEVIKSGDIKRFTPPINCLHCGEPLTVEGKHLMCVNDNCIGLAKTKFAHAVNYYEIKNIGGSMINQLFESGFTSVFDLLDSKITNKQTLIDAGIPNGKVLDILTKGLSNIKTISLQHIILMMGFKGMGRTASLQVAKNLSGQSYSYDGLEKIVVDGFDKTSGSYMKLKKIEKVIAKLNSLGIIVEAPEDISKSIKVEFTGSPKPLFNSKKEFLEAIASKGIAHTKIKDADYLITDNLEGKSAKMKKAILMRKGGATIKTVTYEQFFKIVG